MTSLRDQVRASNETNAVPTVGKEGRGNPIMEFIEGFVSPTSRASTFQNKVMQAITFGGIDNAISAVKAGVKAPLSDKSFREIYNEDQAAELEIRKKQDEAHPAIGGAGSVLGSLMSPDPTGKIKLLGKAGQVAKSTVSGATSGALQSFGEADVSDWKARMKAAADGAIWGGATGTLLGTGGKAVSSVLSRKAARNAQKALDTMNDETNAVYDASRATGELIPGTITSQNVLGAMQDIRTTMGYRAPHHERLEAVLEDLDKSIHSQTPNGPKAIDMNIADLDETQRKLWKSYKNLDGPDKRNLLKVIKALDDAAEQGAAQGSELLKAARNKSRMERNTRIFDAMMDDATLSSKAGSGDPATKYRQQARALLKNKKYSQFFNNEEKAALRQIVEGTTPGNIARFIGNFAPTSGNMASLISALTVYHNPAMAIPALSGSLLARAGSSSSTAKAVEEARRVLSGSPTPAASVQSGPLMAKVAGQTAAPDLPSLLDMSGLTQPEQAVNPTLMELNKIYQMKQQQQQGPR